MSAAEIIGLVLHASGQIAADGADLVLAAPRPLPGELLDRLKAHKPDILAALARPDDIALWWRVAITEPSALTVEVDTPSGYTLTDWQTYAERYHGPGCAVTPIAGLPKPRAPVNLEQSLAGACEGVAITPEVFRSLLSREDLDDIEAGGIHRKTLGAYALSFAEGMRSGRIGAPVHVLEGAKPGPVSGSIIITEAELDAARKGRTVRGEFTGAPDVKL
jgi:hypothetical protein